jgi:hypothetical protein
MLNQLQSQSEFGLRLLTSIVFSFDQTARGEIAIGDVFVKT